CLSDADITGTGARGAIVGGYFDGYGVWLEQCIGLGNILGTGGFAGGLVGSLPIGAVRITNSYAGCEIDVGGTAGGLVADHGNRPDFVISGADGTQPFWVENCLVNTNIKGVGECGRLAVRSYNGGYRLVYVNTEKTNLPAVNYAFGYTPSQTMILNLSESETKSKATYPTFDWTVWGVDPDINGGYPTLRWAYDFAPPGPEDKPKPEIQDGSKEHPIIIYTPQLLADIGRNATSLSQHYKLGNDLDLSGGTFRGGLGTRANQFKGSLDGSGYKIGGLTTGLFAFVGPGGYIHDLLAEGNIAGRGAIGIVATQASGGTYENIATFGTLRATNYGSQLYGDSYAGGVVGSSDVHTPWGTAETMTFINCVNYATIHASLAGAGILGQAGFGSPQTPQSVKWRDMMIEPDMPLCNFYYCRNYGTIYGGRGTGGIAGHVGYGYRHNYQDAAENDIPFCTFYRCISKADIVVKDLHGSYYGGITGGYTSGREGIRLIECAAINEADVSCLYPNLQMGISRNGGLTGAYNGGHVEIFDCYIGGTLGFKTGETSGGITGQITTSNAGAPSYINNVFLNTNMPIDLDWASQFARVNEDGSPMLNDSGEPIHWAKWADRFGILGGEVSNTLTYTNCYYNTDMISTLFRHKLFGYVVGQPTSANNIAYTTEQCREKENFPTFDFDNIWGINPAINDGRPFLWWCVEEYEGGKDATPPFTHVPTPIATPPTPEPTPTATATPTATPTPTATEDFTPTPDATLETTPELTPSITLEIIPTVTITPSSSPTQTAGKQTPAVTDASKFKLGDANCDSLVNIDDILLVRDAIFGTKPITPQGRINLQMQESDKPNIDHILLIRDAIFGVKT
ncbi:MAG: hypothetical protein FWD16_03660, partial [Clostridia bacterium]|nr:hypothetical protein [Clostridia bacterium]